MNRLYLIAVLLLLTSCGLMKPTVTPLDTEADALMIQGKRLLQNDKYTEALDKFELVRNRNFNRSTTAAIYLSGLSAYYLKYDDIASQRFATIEEEFPRSRYLEEAQYHQALIKLRSKNPVARFQGYESLLSIANNARTSKMTADAQAKIQQVLFEVFTPDELEKAFTKADSKHKEMVAEAFFFRNSETGDYTLSRKKYADYLRTGGKDSPYLQSLFPKIDSTKKITVFEPEIIRLGMFLPFFFREGEWKTSKTISPETLRSLEFYEGFKIAVDEFSAVSTHKKVYLKLFDTRSDSLLTRSFYRDLETLRPHLIIGDIYNGQSRVLSDWAEQNKTLHLIPISASSELVERKSYTFLAHPSAYTHGQRLAEFAYNVRGVTRTAVFTDGSEATEDLAKGYITTFLQLGGRIDTLKFSLEYKGGSINQIPKLVSKIPNNEPNMGVYIPLMGNEEAASLIVNMLKREGKNITLMGSPHFRSRYNTLEREAKEGFGLVFTTSHFDDVKDTAYRELYKVYVEKYNYPPSDNIIQGYDLGKYVLQMLSMYDPSLGITPDTYLRVYPLYRGIHLDYRFNSQQSNQRVNIGMYTPEGVVRLNVE
ncbi:MAG: ABC transporter substrate-binding protein [Bacteroidia bacterium]|nr:ABC transporter substrate-binding protein [Bacteroidia bacterium]